MAKIITVDTYDLVSKKSEKRNINADHIIEVEKLISYDSKPLTRIKLVNGDFLDTQKNFENILKIINEQGVLSGLSCDSTVDNLVR